MDIRDCKLGQRVIYVMPSFMTGKRGVIVHVDPLQVRLEDGTIDDPKNWQIQKEEDDVKSLEQLRKEVIRFPGSK